MLSVPAGELHSDWQLFWKADWLEDIRLWYKVPWRVFHPGGNVPFSSECRGWLSMFLSRPRVSQCFPVEMTELSGVL